MNKYAVMVDAGYLLASMARVLTGSSNRNMIQVSWEKLVQQMKQEIDTLQQAQSKGSELLRVQWYDSPPEEYEGKRLAEESFLAIDAISRTKTRIGRTSFGNQKGVDVKLALDIVNLSMRGLVTDLYLVSGDDDLTEAVELAQDYGVRVHLYNVGALDDSPVKAKFGLYSTATNLARRADERHIISADLIKRAAVIAPRALQEEADAEGEGRIEAVAKMAAAAAGIPGEASAETVQLVSEAVASGAAGAAAAGRVVPTPGKPGPRLSGEPQRGSAPSPAARPGAGASAASSSASAPTPTPTPAPKPAGPITPKIAPLKKQEITFRPPATGASYSDYERIATETLHEAMRSVVKQTVESLQKVGRVEAVSRKYTRPSIPSDIDRGLLIDICLAMGEPDMDIAAADRETMRALFWDEVEQIVE